MAGANDCQAAARGEVSSAESHLSIGARGEECAERQPEKQAGVLESDSAGFVGGRTSQEAVPGTPPDKENIPLDPLAGRPYRKPADASTTMAECTRAANILQQGSSLGSASQSSEPTSRGREIFSTHNTAPPVQAGEPAVVHSSNAAPSGPSPAAGDSCPMPRLTLLPGQLSLAERLASHTQASSSAAPPSGDGTTTPSSHSHGTEGASPPKHHTAATCSLEARFYTNYVNVALAGDGDLCSVLPVSPERLVDACRDGILLW